MKHEIQKQQILEIFEIKKIEIIESKIEILKRGNARCLLVYYIIFQFLNSILFYRMGSLPSFYCQFFATQTIDDARELVVFLRLSGDI